MQEVGRNKRHRNGLTEKLKWKIMHQEYTEKQSIVNLFSAVFWLKMLL